MSHPTITLFRYEGSPYAYRVRWYLAFRGIPYADCVCQPSPIPSSIILC